MAKTDRSAQFTKLQKVLRKHYEPVLPLADRSLLEHLLFAVCLENSPYDKAEDAFARLQVYDDWNEIRVTSQTELQEMMGGLGDPAGSATRVKGVLQGVFEQGLFDQKYNYDIDPLRKQNIGKAIKELEKFPSVTPFVAAYVTQAGLGGHAIPLDQGTLDAMLLLDLISDKDREKGVAPGLERAIPKNKGAEFASLLHQLGADYYNAAHTPRVRAILLEINPDIKDRLPKRPGKEAAEPAAEARPAKKAASKPAAAKEATSKAPPARDQPSKEQPAKEEKPTKAAKGEPKKKPPAKAAPAKPAAKTSTKRKPR
jgi:endonuclease III